MVVNRSIDFDSKYVNRPEGGRLDTRQCGYSEPPVLVVSFHQDNRLLYCITTSQPCQALLLSSAIFSIVRRLSVWRLAYSSGTLASWNVAEITVE